MIMNPADAMMQRSVKSVHSSDLSRETRKRFFPKRIMSEQEARVACKTRRWQTATPHTSTDLHSCLKSVEGIFTWKERKGDRDREKRTLMTASDVQIDIILALLAPREEDPSSLSFFFSFFFVPPKPTLAHSRFFNSLDCHATRLLHWFSLDVWRAERGSASLKFNPLSKLFAGITAIFGTSVAKKHLRLFHKFQEEGTFAIIDSWYVFDSTSSWLWMRMIFKRKRKEKRCTKYSKYNAIFEEDFVYLCFIKILFCINCYFENCGYTIIQCCYIFV